MAYVPSRAVAEEVVQETWMAVMREIDGFEGRSSLKTWIFRILTNLAIRLVGSHRCLLKASQSLRLPFRRVARALRLSARASRETRPAARPASAA